MVKKLLHFICFLVAGLLWSLLLLVVAREVCMLIDRIDIFSPLTYYRLSAYWNGGGVLHTKDILMILGISLYIPICLYGLYKLYHYQYMRLLTVPLNFLANLGMGDYRAPDVNIKNLKIEEKKSIEQIVQERLNLEKRKNQQNTNSADFRQQIIKEIEEKTK